LLLLLLTLLLLLLLAPLLLLPLLTLLLLLLLAPLLLLALLLLLAMPLGVRPSISVVLTKLSAALTSYKKAVTDQPLRSRATGSRCFSAFFAGSCL
jgi:hypothetical protein